MLSQVAKLAEILSRVADRVKETRDSRIRREQIVDLLTVYFILLNIGKVGARLVTLAGDDPKQKVMTMAASGAGKWLVKCRLLMRAQRNNLGRLGELLLYENLPVVEVLDPDLIAELKEVIGSKARGLFSIGAALEIYMIFGSIPDAEEIQKYGEATAGLRYTASMVELLLSPEGEPIVVRRVIEDLQTLRKMASRFRKQIVFICSREELLRFAAVARTRASSEKLLRPNYKFGRILLSDE